MDLLCSAFSAVMEVRKAGGELSPGGLSPRFTAHGLGSISRMPMVEFCFARPLKPKPKLKLETGLDR